MPHFNCIMDLSIYIIFPLMLTYIYIYTKYRFKRRNRNIELNKKKMEDIVEYSLTFALPYRK